MPLADTLQGTNSPAIPVPEAFQLPYLALNAGTIAAFLYASLYVLLEPVAGAMVSPFIIASAAAGNYLVPEYGATANYAAIGIHIVSWIAQFIGHGKFEGRAPALLDNIVQALFLAPLFVWLEFLFMVGYRPELKRRLDIGVEKEIAKFRKEQTEKKGKANGKTK